ncbi:putative lysophospholipase catalytic domain containing protein [Rhypophila decipiens]
MVVTSCPTWGQLLATSILISTCLAEPIPHASEVQLRALPNSPSGDYAPAVVPCPQDRPTVRSAQKLSQQETSWLERRRKATVDPMIKLVERNKIDGFDAGAYIRNAADNDLSSLPNIAIAVSGGGYRALMNGAGFLAAADDRTTDSTGPGGIGGLLQASTYLAGLSGGGWLVGSIFANNFSSVEALRNGLSPDTDVWNFTNSIFAGPGESFLQKTGYWFDIVEQVGDKADAGFETSITDYWGRALSYQLINAPEGGPAYTFSSIAEVDHFKNAETPFPILVADGRAPGERIISLNTTVFEFNPYEMGSFDPTVFAFVPTKYLASNFSNGVIPKDGSCVNGFDQLGFVMGTSSSLFNQFLLQNISAADTKIPAIVVSAIEKILASISNDNNDIAQYTPNPFYKYNPSANPSAESPELSLVDGGEDLQNIPLHPLIQPTRKVDVIFAIDSSADTPYNWPNGTALRASYDRSLLSDIANGTLFPPVPDANTFINSRLNQRPTFFGCDVRNFTSGNGAPPLLIYIPNAPYSAYSNVSTFTPEYTSSERNNIIQNGYNVATMGNNTVDGSWTTCVSCAIFSRSWARTNTAVPQQCVDCFDRFCWDGTLNSSSTSLTENYEPGFIVGEGASGTKDNAASASSGLSGMGMGMAVAGVLSLSLAL